MDHRRQLSCFSARSRVSGGLGNAIPWGVGALLTALASPGCAAAPPPNEGQISAAFAKIQIHEARLERHRTAARRPVAECLDLCEDAAGACREAAQVCRIARSIDDTDAISRCSQAQDVCLAARRGVSERCSCAEGS